MTALKAATAALDIRCVMRMQDLKLCVERSDYIVDPALVAAALLRKNVSYRRCWKPRVAWTAPSQSSSTPARPSWTAPIHASGAADSAA